MLSEIATKNENTSWYNKDLYGVDNEFIELTYPNSSKTFEEVQEKTDVGTVCGTCIEDVENLIAELTGK